VKASQWALKTMKLFFILLEIDFDHLINGKNKRADNYLYRKNLPTTFILSYLNVCEHLRLFEGELKICRIKNTIRNFSQKVLG